MFTIKNYRNFYDRASRSEYWYFISFLFFLSLSSGVIEIYFGSNFMFYILNIIQIILVFPTISVTTRRLHDVNKSGYLQLLLFTGIGIGILLAFLTMKSQDLNIET